MPRNLFSFREIDISCRKINMKDIAQNQLHRTAFRSDYKVNTPGVGCDLLLQLLVEHDQQSDHGDTERQQQDVQCRVQRPRLEIIPDKQPEIHAPIVSYFRSPPVGKLLTSIVDHVSQLPAYNHCSPISPAKAG